MSLITSRELAELLGVKPTNFTKWEVRYSAFPAPLRHARGEMRRWVREDVLEWAAAHDRYDPVVGIGTPRRPRHGINMYRKGCRCEHCVSAMRRKWQWDKLRRSLKQQLNKEQAA